MQDYQPGDEVSEDTVIRVCAQNLDVVTARAALTIWQKQYAAVWGPQTAILKYCEEIRKNFKLPPDVQLRLINAFRAEAKRLEDAGLSEPITRQPLTRSRREALFANNKNPSAGFVPENLNTTMATTMSMGRYLNQNNYNNNNSNNTSAAPESEIPDGDPFPLTPEEHSFSVLLIALTAYAQKVNNEELPLELLMVKFSRKLPILRELIYYLKSDLSKPFMATRPRAHSPTEVMSDFIHDVYVQFAEWYGPAECDERFSRAMEEAQKHPANLKFNAKNFF